ncbi:MAG: sigma-70 family RNA polymerase sigma factor, partial [Proteiniphilum sp.]|nr:sigma-70 family RNA polymerase sigma factor [Proteiniphilum sp.]
MKIKDSKLLFQISQKDAKAFDAFYDRYIKMIYRFVYRELNDEMITDDLIQDFWLRVWEDSSFLKCNEKGSVQSYMLQHLRFRILDLYRKTLTNLFCEYNPDKAERELEFYNSITEEMNEKELLLIIREALENQSQIIRNTFWMRINNWSVEETARTLSVSSKTVYNKYSESLIVVRAYIRNRYPEFADIRKIGT